MANIEQTDFSSGMFRGRRAPKNSCFDAVNALISDEGELFRRGGSEYKSGSNAGSTGSLIGLWDGHLLAGQRTVFWTSTTFNRIYVLEADDSTPFQITGTAAPTGPPIEAGGLLIFPVLASGGAPREFVYAGSRKQSYVTGTVSTTAGSATVTGAGTSWTANVDPGMILISPSSSTSEIIGVVRSVESNTSLTLTRPARVTLAAAGYSLSTGVFRIPGTASASLFPGFTTQALAVAGQRLIRTFDNRAYFSRPAQDPLFFGDGTFVGAATIEDITTDYHELPRAALIVGANAIQDTLILFTTAGVWAITNMALDPVDSFGNIQHQVQQISQQVILWGDAGVAAHENVLIVPAVDDVYAFAPGATPKALSESIRPYYRELVEAGYKPGLATVYRGHYLLPILESDNDVVTTLVCRLDKGPAWTRWANGASGRAYARRVGATTREPELLGLDALRVSDLTGCFTPSAAGKDDADGTDHAIEVTTSDYPLSRGLQKGHVIKVRATYSLVDAASDDPSTTMQWSRGPEGSSFTTLTNLASTSPFHAGERDGTGYASWAVGKTAEYMRFKWSTVGAAESATLRKIELVVRPSGRQ